MTAHRRLGFDRHQMTYRVREHQRDKQSWWAVEVVNGHSYRMEENRGVWVRFSELNQLRYYHTHALRLAEFNGAWRQADLKRVWRLIVERAARCDGPRLP